MSLLVRELLGIFAALAAFALLIGALAFLRKRRHIGPEMSRKLLHIGMGFVVLTFPWLFPRPWPVLVLSAVFVLLFLGRKVFRRAGSALSDVIDGVGRSSLGELYFAVSVAVVFLFARGDRMLFVIPMLLLTLPDAVAALIGVRYGQHPYWTGPNALKSAEGSVAFFAVAVLSVHVPLLLFTPTGRAETLLIACTLALLAMILEGIAWRGADNLLVPLGAFILLKAFLRLDRGDLAECLAVAAACLAFALIWRRRSTLDGGAALSAALVLYLAWALGGWRWLIAPATNLVAYAILWPRTERERLRGHNTHAVVSVAAAGLVWLFLQQTVGWINFFYSYTLAFAVHLAIIGVARLRRVYPEAPTLTLVGTCAAQGWLLLFAPYLAVMGAEKLHLLLAALALPVVAAAVSAFYATQPGIRDCPADLPRWFRQGAYAAVASAAGLLPVLAA